MRQFTLIYVTTSGETLQRQLSQDCYSEPESVLLEMNCDSKPLDIYTILVFERTNQENTDTIQNSISSSTQKVDMTAEEFTTNMETDTEMRMVYFQRISEKTRINQN